MKTLTTLVLLISLALLGCQPEPPVPPGPGGKRPTSPSTPTSPTTLSARISSYCAGEGGNDGALFLELSDGTKAALRITNESSIHIEPEGSTLKDLEGKDVDLVIDINGNLVSVKAK